MLRIVAAFAVLLTLLASSSRAGLGFVKRAGPHFRVLCHFDDPACADAALETAEATWPLASELYGLPPGPLDTLFDVHLYRNAAEYLATEREVGLGDFDKNLAFSSFETRSAYVAVQPDLGDEALAAVGLTAQTRHLVAHEAAHLVRYRVSPGFRSHPGWLADGAAKWIAEETLAARGWSAGGAEDPYVATEMVRAQRLVAGGHLPSASALLRDETKGMEFYDRYAVRKLLFRRLITRNDAPAFRAALAKALALPDGPDYAKRFLETVTAPYQAEGLAGLDLDYEQYVRSQTPAWEEVFRGLATAGDAWVQTAFADNNAIAWRTAPVGGAAYELRAEIEILPSAGKRQMNLLLGRHAGGFVSVTFVAGYGADVLAYSAADGKWETLASAPTKAVQLWRRVPVRVSVDGSKLTLRIDGTDVATVDLKDRPMSGAWGLGVQAGGAGVWRRVKLDVPAK
jgi:hypothetical protein